MKFLNSGAVACTPVWADLAFTSAASCLADMSAVVLISALPAWPEMMSCLPEVTPPDAAMETSDFTL